MPVSGAFTHQLYSELGFKTAWHLLPSQHQNFDSMENHVDRYLLQARAVRWLWENPEVFETNQARAMLIDNQVQCMLVSSQAGRELYNIINENT